MNLARLLGVEGIDVRSSVRLTHEIVLSCVILETQEDPFVDLPQLPLRREGLLLVWCREGKGLTIISGFLYWKGTRGLT